MRRASNSLTLGFFVFVLCMMSAIVVTVTSNSPLKAQQPEQSLELKDVNGKIFPIPANSEFTVLCFLGTECPLAKLYAPRLAALSQEFSSKGFTFLGINSNQQDSKQEWIEFAKENELAFPIAKDVGNVVADQFQIERTPEVVVLNSQGNILYRGRIDDQYSPGIVRSKPKRQDLRIAMEELVSGSDVSIPKSQPEGCLLGRVKAKVENPKVTFSQHIGPIFQKHCVECHRSGDIGPFVLDDYDEVVGWGEMIVETMDNGRMPPWHADPNHGEFRNARLVSKKEKELVRQWVADGCPLGDAGKTAAKNSRVEGWRLTREPDLVVEMRNRPFTVPSDGTVEYQYFVVDPGFKEDKWVSEAEVVPGNRSIVHHSIVFIRPPDGQRSYGVGWLGAYVPGQLPLKYDRKRARRIPAGSKLVFQQHYTPNGIEQEDKTRIGMVFVNEEDVENELMTLIAINQEFEIPPNQSETNVEASVGWIPRDGMLLSISPHMHYRGKSFIGWAKQQNEADETLLSVPNYDFNWQHIYEFSKPLPLKDIESLDIKVTFDNSDDNPFNPNPNEFVTWGDQTWEEMAIAFFDVTVPRNKPEVKTEVKETVSVSGAKAKEEVQYSPEVIKFAEEFTNSYFSKNDTNKDGKLERDEVPIVATWNFKYVDVDKDGFLTRKEIDDRARYRYQQKRSRR